ncbi:nucleoid-associated protein [Candidatus Aerophobetes bacterium]|uniref:Nucleoid-associated protein COB21_01685 n=1 Tax=Aerophobetes bacterium TaxID=2030807 RepID=A0A2A4X6V1_UNCAE|nr:MAG: nucleoid-associated protein [Candidatus Aerophobetes bacterium]
MGTGFSKMKKQARMLQDQMEKMQEETKNLSVQGSSGNGLVTITLSGDHKMQDITIKKECIDPEDSEGLQDLIAAAYEDALNQIESAGPSMDGLPFNLPF